jgi:hypothetical protein
VEAASKDPAIYKEEQDGQLVIAVRKPTEIDEVTRTMKATLLGQPNRDRVRRGDVDCAR